MIHELDIMAKELNVLYKEVSSLRWAQYTTGFDFGLAAAEEKVSAFKRDKTRFEKILKAREGAGDSLTRRKIQIIHRAFKDSHHSPAVRKIQERIEKRETELMGIINNFRCRMHGREISTTERGQVMAESPDRASRRDAYAAMVPLNHMLVQGGFLELLKLRRELAELCGFSSFVDYNLEGDDLTRQFFHEWRQVGSSRLEKFKGKSALLAQRHLELDQLAPWDHRFLQTKVCEANRSIVDMSHFMKPISKIFSSEGFNLESLNLTYDIFPRKNKSEWGYNFVIENGRDSRILANVSNRFSDLWVLLHETAHGVHYMGLDTEEPLLNWGVSGIVAEGFANFMGNRGYDRDFITEVFGDALAERGFLDFENLLSVVHFQNYRLLPDILFDQELYLRELKNADDVQVLRQNFGSEILGEDGHEIPWAQLIHHTSHPIYLHNYFLGDCLGEMMRVDFQEKRKRALDGVNVNPSLGQHWKKRLLDPSGKWPFLEVTKNALGRELLITDYIDGKCLA